MPRTATSVRGFNGGEISPRMYGRSDLPAYQVGGRRVENFIPLVQGPLLRRSGTRFVAEVKDSDDAVVLIPFTVSTLASYVIEAGPLYFRFYTSEARLESGGSPVEVVTPYTAADLADLQWAQSADVLYLVHPDHEPRKLTRTSATAFSLDTILPIDGPYLDENTTSTTLTPSATSGAGITITASAVAGINDGAGFVASDVGRVVRIFGGGQWGYAEITVVNSVVSVDADVKSDFGGTSAEKRWRLGVWYSLNYPRTVTFHQNRLWFGGPTDFIQRIDGSVVGDFEVFAPHGLASDDPAYSEDTVDDTNAVSFTVSSDELNAILWARVSKSLVLGTSSSIFNMRASSTNEIITPTNITVTEDRRIGSATVQPVVSEDAVLYLGRAQRSLEAASFRFEDDGFSVTDLTEFADHILRTGGLRITRTQQPHSLIWVVTNDGYLVSLTLRPRQRVAAWANHPIGGSWPGRSSAFIESVARMAESDHDQLWLVAKRTINGATKRYIEFMEESFRFLDPTQPIEEAFFVDSGLTLDGADAADPTTVSGATQADPVVVTVTGHPYLDGDRVRITKVIGMTELNQRSFLVSNAGVNTFELQDLDGTDVDGTAFTAYVQGGECRKATTAVSGASHLEGETVAILGDGSPRPSLAVASGSVTLATPASHVHLGLAMPSVFESLSLELRDPEGASQGKAQVFDRAILRFHDTVGAELGPSESNLAPVLFRDSGDPMSVPLAPQSVDKRVTFIGGWDRDHRVLVRQMDPLPMTLVAMTLLGQLGGR